MKLIMLEHPEHGIWYFTNKAKVADFIGTSFINVLILLEGFYKRCDGWTAQWIESDDILSRYINPDRKKVFGDNNKNKKE